MKKVLIKRKNNSISYIYQDQILWGILPNKILSFFVDLKEDSQDLSEEKWFQILQELEKYAYEKTISYLARRERSQREVEHFLKRNGFQQSMINPALSRAKDHHYLNDERFAEMYCHDLIQKHKSRREIKAKLIAKGISQETIEKTILEKYPPNEENEIIESLMNKVSEKYQNHPQKREKVFNYLYRKGFSYDAIERQWLKQNEKKEK